VGPALREPFDPFSEGSGREGGVVQGREFRLLVAPQVDQYLDGLAGLLNEMDEDPEGPEEAAEEAAAAGERDAGGGAAGAPRTPVRPPRSPYFKYAGRNYFWMSGEGEVLRIVTPPYEEWRWMEDNLAGGEWMVEGQRKRLQDDAVITRRNIEIEEIVFWNHIIRRHKLESGVVLQEDEEWAEHAFLDADDPPVGIPALLC